MLPVLPVGRVVIEVGIRLPGQTVPSPTRGTRLSPRGRNLCIAKAGQVRAKRILIDKALRSTRTREYGCNLVGKAGLSYQSDGFGAVARNALTKFIGDPKRELGFIVALVRALY